MMDQVASGVLVVGLLAVLCGFVLASVVHGRVVQGPLNGWKWLFKQRQHRIEDQLAVMRQVLNAENTTWAGRAADWFLRRGTVLFVVGAVTKAMVFFIERQSA